MLLPLNGEVDTGRKLHEVTSSWTFNVNNEQALSSLASVHTPTSIFCKTSFCKTINVLIIYQTSMENITFNFEHNPQNVYTKCYTQFFDENLRHIYKFI